MKAHGRIFRRPFYICSVIFSFTFWLHLQCSQITLADSSTSSCGDGLNEDELPRLNLVNFQSDIVDNGNIFNFVNAQTEKVLFFCFRIHYIIQTFLQSFDEIKIYKKVTSKAFTKWFAVDLCWALKCRLDFSKWFWLASNARKHSPKCSFGFIAPSSVN